MGRWIVARGKVVVIDIIQEANKGPISFTAFFRTNFDDVKSISIKAKVAYK